MPYVLTVDGNETITLGLIAERVLYAISQIGQPFLGSESRRELEKLRTLLLDAAQFCRGQAKGDVAAFQSFIQLVQVIQPTGTLEHFANYLEIKSNELERFLDGQVTVWPAIQEFLQELKEGAYGWQGYQHNKASGWRL